MLLNKYDPSAAIAVTATTLPMPSTKFAYKEPPAFVPIPFTVLSASPLASLNTLPLKSGAAFNETPIINSSPAFIAA